MTATAKLTGITAGAGQCDCCGRRITRAFQVRYTNGTLAILGRACCAKVTGYAATKMERLAESEARYQAKLEADRANGTTLEEMIRRAQAGGCLSEAEADRWGRAWFAQVYPERVAA